MNRDLVNFVIRALEPDATGFERQTARAAVIAYRGRELARWDTAVAAEEAASAMCLLPVRSTHYYDAGTDAVKRIPT